MRAFHDLGQSGYRFLPGDGPRDGIKMCGAVDDERFLAAVQDLTDDHFGGMLLALSVDALPCFPGVDAAPVYRWFTEQHANAQIRRKRKIDGAHYGEEGLVANPFESGVLSHCVPPHL